MPVVLNYTTQVPVAKTLAEVQRLLADQGANAVMTRFAPDRIPSAVSFTLPGVAGDRAFTLPVDVEAVYRLLNSRAIEDQYRRRHGRPLRPEHRTREHAARMAWRTAQDWLESQMAMVQAQMVALDQVMLPYLHVAGETTLYQAYCDNNQRALTAAGGTQ